jgi:hypothetical protein
MSDIPSLESQLADADHLNTLLKRRVSELEAEVRRLERDCLTAAKINISQAERVSQLEELNTVYLNALTKVYREIQKPTQGAYLFTFEQETLQAVFGALATTRQDGDK